jgi:hypothetical protein
MINLLWVNPEVPALLIGVGYKSRRAEPSPGVSFGVFARIFGVVNSLGEETPDDDDQRTSEGEGVRLLFGPP